MQGHLFTEYFLTDGIQATPEWRGSADAYELFKDEAGQLYNRLYAYENPNEAVTEQDLIHPILEILGWKDYLPQQGTERNEDIPDFLLFPNAAAKNQAAARNIPNDRFLDALVVGESKRLNRPLDALGKDSGSPSRNPHGQILRYLDSAHEVSQSRIRWGFLTNGGVWRLYDQHARPRATAYFEADLGKLLESGNDDRLRAFYLLFRRESFILQGSVTATFVETALAEGRRYEEKVAHDLSRVVFKKVFPEMVKALASRPRRRSS